MYTYEETLTQIKQESFFHKQVREDMYGLEVTAYSNYDPYLFLDDYGDIVQIIGETSHDGKEGRVYSTKILQMKSGNMKNHRLDNDVTYNTIEHIRNLLKSKSPRYMGEIIGNNLNVCRYSNKPITAPQSSFIYATESGEILIEMSHTTIGSVNNANHSDLRDFDTYSQRLAYDCYGKMQLSGHLCPVHLDLVTEGSPKFIMMIDLIKSEDIHKKGFDLPNATQKVLKNLQEKGIAFVSSDYYNPELAFFN